MNNRGNNKPRKRRGRTRWLLEKLRQFAVEKGWWPSASELSAYIGRGSRWTTWRDMRALQHPGFVAMQKRKWTVTAKGFTFIGMTPIYPRFPCKPSKKARKQTRAEKRRRRLLACVAAHNIFMRDLPLVE